MLDTVKQGIKLISIYGRVSTSNQENEGTIETQLAAVKEFAQKNNYTIVQEYLDNGWSGDSIVRPALDQLRMDAKKKIWEAVLIYDPDRLARRYSYQELLMDELREAGIEIIFVTISAPKNSEDKILHGVRGLFAEYERAKISERFRLGKIRKAKEGHILASEAPYGYTFITKKGKPGDPDFRQGYYEINETEARVVKMIFSWIADEGLTMRKVVKRLQELAISPRKSKRGVWNTSTFSTLLRNKTYIGEWHYGASYAVVPENPLKKGGYKKIKKTSRRIKPEEEWIKIPTPALIDEGLFMRAQRQLKVNFEMSSRNKKNQYLLAGKIRCTCGRSRAGEGPQRGKHLYYRCTSRVHSYPLPSPCVEKGINARIADKLVWFKVAQLMSSKELMLKQIKRWAASRSNGSHISKVDTDSMRNEVAKLKKQEDRYAKAYAEGLFSIEKLQEYTTPVRENIASFESQIAKAQTVREELNDSVPITSQEIGAFAIEAAQALRDLNFEAKQRIVRNIVDRVVGTQKELQVFGYIPVTNINVFTVSRNCRFAERGKVHAVSGADEKKGGYRKLPILHD